MNYATKQNHPGENVVGLALVVALHAVVIYFLATALVSVVSTTRPPQPIDVAMIKEPPKPPTPIANSVATPNPKFYSEPIILDQLIVIVEPPVGPTPDRIANADIRNYPQSTLDARKGNAVSEPSPILGIACPNAQRVREELRYPAAARRDGVQGDVLVRFVVGIAGEIKNISILNSSNRALSNAAISAVKQFSCAAQGQDVAVEVPFSFRLHD